MKLKIKEREAYVLDSFSFLFYSYNFLISLGNYRLGKIRPEPIFRTEIKGKIWVWVEVFRPGSKDGVNPYLTYKGWVGSSQPVFQRIFIFPPCGFAFFFFGFLSLYYYVRN